MNFLECLKLWTIKVWIFLLNRTRAFYTFYNLSNMLGIVTCSWICRLVHFQTGSDRFIHISNYSNLYQLIIKWYSIIEPTWRVHNLAKTFKNGRGQKCEVILSSFEDFWINVSSPITEFEFSVHEKMCSQKSLNQVYNSRIPNLITLHEQNDVITWRGW